MQFEFNVARAFGIRGDGGIFQVNPSSIGQSSYGGENPRNKQTSTDSTPALRAVRGAHR